MATLNDPRAAGFNEAAFRDAIRFAMQMGAPDSVSERATFRWPPQRTFDQADPAGNTYNWNSTPATEVAAREVRVDVAVEFAARPAGSVDTPLGQFDISRAIITVADNDYESIQGAPEVILGGNTYEVDFVGPPVGLFGVTFYTLYCSARDES